MSKILLPVDGSESSLRAVRYVASRAAQLKEPVEILLLNVQPPAQPRKAAGAADAGSLEAPMRQEGDKVLAPARKVLDDAGAKYKHHVELGEPVEVIGRYARIYHCDEIVMGTRGMTSILNLVMGSVTTKVLHVTNVPVVLVK